MKLRICVFYGGLMMSSLAKKGDATEILLTYDHPRQKYTREEIFSIRDEMTKEQLSLPENSPERAAIEAFNKIMAPK